MSIDTTRARGRRGRAGGRRRRGQRRLRRARRPGHGRAWSPTPAARGSSCTGAATPRGMRDLAALRRRGRRGARRAARSGSTRRSPPASRRTGSSSTPASASPRRAEHNWRSAAHLRRAGRRSASRCCSGPAASRTSAACWPTPDGTPRPVDEPGGGDHRHQRAGRRRRRLGGAGARRARHRRRARGLARDRRPAAGGGRPGVRRERPDQADRPAGPRPPRRLRLRARRRARTSSSTRCWSSTWRRPPRSDDVADTVHYGELAGRLVDDRRRASRST